MVLSKVWDKRPFDYDEINVMDPGQDKWKAVYEFDTPVVHVDPGLADGDGVKTSTASRKLMHRFQEDQVEQLMDQVQNKQ